MNSSADNMSHTGTITISADKFVKFIRHAKDSKCNIEAWVSPLYTTECSPTILCAINCEKFSTLIKGEDDKTNNIVVLKFTSYNDDKAFHIRMDADSELFIYKIGQGELSVGANKCNSCDIHPFFDIVLTENVNNEKLTDLLAYVENENNTHNN